MDSINLPNIESKEEIPEPPPEIQQIVNTAEPVIEQEESIFIDKPKEEEGNIEPVVKKKRKASQKQLDNLARMRERRAENRAAAKVEEKIPAAAKPVKRQNNSHEELPAMPHPINVDGFYNFMNYMEQYKNLKNNWRHRENEKSAKNKPPPEPKKKEEPKPVKQQTQKIPNLLSTQAKPKSLYDDYF
tara:strand:- start:1832 stop:2392 length:561 start_codon:yes stop_codon:yes gene_type:complete